MNADELNAELDRWNRFHSPNRLIPSAESGAPLACLPFISATQNTFNRLIPWLAPFLSTSENPDAPPGLNPALTLWGELADEPFETFDVYPTPANQQTPTASADDFFKELQKRNDFLAAQYFAPSRTGRTQGADSLWVGSAFSGWETVTRNISVPDCSDLEAEAAFNARAAYVLANLEGETEAEGYQSSAVPSTSGAACGSQTIEAEIVASWYGINPDVFRIVIEAKNNAPLLALNGLRQPIKLLLIWQDLPFSIASASDASDSGLSEDDGAVNPEIVPAFTAPLAADSLSCSALWNPQTESGFLGFGEFQALPSFYSFPYPRMVWNEPTLTQDEGYCLLSEAIENLKIQWKEFEIAPLETVELLPKPLTLPENLTLADLTTFHDVKIRRRFAAAWRPVF